MVNKNQIKRIIEGYNQETYDLKAEFHKWNRKLFDDKLILNFDLKWIKGKKIAFCLAYRNRLTQELRIDSLNVSDSFKMDYNQFSKIFIHELIHIKLMQNGKDDGHGMYFMNELKRINSLGYNIPVTEETFNLQLDKSVKIKPTFFVLRKSPDNKYNVVFFKTYNAENLLIRLGYDYYSERNYKFYIGQTTQDIVAKYKINNNENSIKTMYSISDIELEQLKKDIKKEL